MNSPSSEHFNYPTGQRAGENAWLWLAKMITGPLLVLILALHLIVNHYMGSAHSGLMTYNDIVAYFRNPLIPLIEIIFVTTVVTHSLLGVRGVILDMNPPQNVLAWVNAVLLLVGCSAIGYGIWLALVIASKST